MTDIADFDPNGAATGDGIFGLPHGRDNAKIHLLPVPFDATTSYGGGASKGPDAIMDASMQVDLYDHSFGSVWKAGIFMDDAPDGVSDLSVKARGAALPIIEMGGVDPDHSGEHAHALQVVNDASEQVQMLVRTWTGQALRDGNIPGIIGGDHSTPLGAIEAAAAHLATSGKTGLGILQIDAHMDLRPAFEGFAQSHASIMHNVMEHVPTIGRLVQVGIRDSCEQEREYAKSQGKAISVWHDQDIANAVADGATLRSIMQKIVADLSEHVWISFDIDGLDPSLCPGTGTPVPGGLSFREMTLLLKTLAASGKQVVGFDLVEVCPTYDDNEWNANVGARVLYKLCGIAATTHNLIPKV
ncbi:MAG: agmatinase family protein [Phycisphaeraceae bacterium]|nr:agmatinase family protein [Phycisphaerales bacterium]MCB9860962.1 agmatinase family protein [Phycisphaeraceae bacterium]